jgi:methionyl-tRNA formyltransferase
LRALVDAGDVEVVAAVTNPDRPAGRGHQLRPPPVKVAATAAGIEVWQPAAPRDVADLLRAADADACAVVAYGAILPADVLGAVRHGFVNLHFSLLPAWRGAAPVPHALLAGDQTTGVTCFVLDERMDTGPLLTTASTPVRAGEDAGQLVARLAELGAPVLVDAVRGLVDGTLTPQPQNHDLATYAPKIRPDDARLDWTEPAERLARAVRAFQPSPGAHTSMRERRLKVHRASAVGGGGAPGQVVGADDAGAVVACGAGALRLEEVQPAGKPRMTGGDFVNGYQPLGQVLGG